jgi:excinuclease ABC subunit A
VTPRLFSFNSPFGACGGCSGLGTVKKVDVESLVPDEQKSLEGGAIALFKEGSTSWRLKQIEQLAKALKFSMSTPWRELPRSVRDVILFGSGGSEIKWKYKSEKGQYQWSSAFKGIVPTLQAKYKEVAGDDAREEIERFMIASPCPDCGGRRLKKALSVLLDGRAIDSLTDMTLDDAQAFFHG